MRKYDFKNKRNIGVIIGISVVIIVMFSLVISFFLGADKKEYQVLPATLVFDKNKTIIKVETGGIIKTKWNNDYYLIYNDKNYELGDTAIAYKEDTGAIYLYGRYYEINNGDEIKVTNDETVVKSSALTKFYKIADRKYLVIDTEIKSSDGLLSTTDFLMVDLDKVGNATLTNHKVNLKTFSETTIVTANYTFDIANEILTFGSDKIDLKKIIGSTNTYTKEDLEPEEDNIVGGNSDDITNITDNTGGTGTGTGTGEGEGNGSGGGGGGGGSDGTGDGSGTGSGGGGGSDGDGTGSGTGGGGSDGTGDGSGTGEGDGTGEGSGSGSGGGSGSGDNEVLEEIKKASKNTSIVSVDAGINKIDVDYVIYDPYNEYISVYMELMREGSNDIEVYYLKSSDTSYTISKDIIPNSNYKILFKCNYIDLETKEEVVETIDDINVTTKLPTISIKVTSTNKKGLITYQISTDANYNITSGLLTISVGDKVYKSYEVTINGNTVDSVLVPEINNGDIVKLTLTDIKSGDVVIRDLNARTMFKK